MLDISVIFVCQISELVLDERADVYYTFAILIGSNARVAWREYSRANRGTEPVPSTESVVALVWSRWVARNVEECEM